MARQINIYTGKPVISLSLDKASVSDIAMTVTVQVVLDDGKKVEQTEACTWKAIMTRATQTDMQEWLVDLMVRDMVSRTEKTAIAVKEVITK